MMDTEHILVNFAETFVDYSECIGHSYQASLTKFQAKFLAILAKPNFAV